LILHNRSYPFRQFLDGIFEKLEGTRLALIIDPLKIFPRDNLFIDPTGRDWRVFRYYGNDISFRKEYQNKPNDPNFRHIVLVIPEEDARQRVIELSYLPDIVGQADEIIDLSLSSILKVLFPNEIFPSEGSYFPYANKIVENLYDFAVKIKEIRNSLGPTTPFSRKHIIIALLASKNPLIPVQKMLFEKQTLEQKIAFFISILLGYDVSDEDAEILREIIIEPDISEPMKWFDAPIADLAQTIVLYDLFLDNNIPNPGFQIKGLGILSFDPEELSEDISKIIKSLKGQAQIWQKAIKVSEETFPETSIEKIIKILNVKDIKYLLRILVDQTSPFMIYGLLLEILKQAIKEKNNQVWCAFKNYDFDKLFLVLEKMETKFSEDARALLFIVHNIIYLQRALAIPVPEHKQLATLISWYVKNEIFKLQIILAKTLRYVTSIADSELRKDLVNYLIKEIKDNIDSYLEKLDQQLFLIISNHFNDYIDFPRLSVNIVRDMILAKGIRFSDNRRLWLLIFDGMRLDTWREVVRPLLEKKFYIKDEEAYICPLPSVTDIARISLLAGALPTNWENYHGDFTSDQEILASRLFGLSKEERKNKLRIVFASETDFGKRRLDFDVKDYNILVYNLSDDWIHTFRGDIEQLNDTIRVILERDVIPDILGRLRDKDIILITSDHGFIELNKENNVEIKNKEQSLIQYRYLKRLSDQSGYQIKWNENLQFSVAKGRTWFSRETGGFHRYSHGGISLDEMIIPAVLLEKTTQAEIEIYIAERPDFIEAIEDKEIQVEILVKSAGNTAGEFNLSAKLDTGYGYQLGGKIGVYEEYPLKFKLAPERRSRSIDLVLVYKDASGKEIKKMETVGIQVIERKEKVEIDFSALDKFDKVIKDKD